MYFIKTKDNTITVFNETYKEACHSLSGALEEARKKYIEPLNVKDGDTILDICFGLGYNTFAAMEQAKNLKIIALEKDKNILNAIQKISLTTTYERVKKLAKTRKYKDQLYDLTILFGPAEETIQTINEQFDCVFLDPFSPKKNPEVWSETFFKEISKRMKPGGKLATYSCARHIRENLKNAGFLVTDGPKINRRGPSTIATKPHL